MGILGILVTIFLIIPKIPKPQQKNLETALPVLYIRRLLLGTDNRIEVGKFPEKVRKEESERKIR
jgi:hypothetical protein